MQNDLSPDYLCSLVPPTVGSTSSYPLRNANDLQIIHANSQLYYNSFCRLLFANGMNSRNKHVIHLVSTYLKPG